MTHTPGPWHVQHQAYFWHIMHSSNGPNWRDVSGIATIQSVSPTAEQAEANAKLIAAAPDLLAALQAVASRLEHYRWMSHIGDEVSQEDGCIAEARAAIDKATN